jgi:uncharacterized protein (TIGR00255 family)
MIKSMTAFGRGSTDSSEGRFVVELHSVNRKGLEIQVHLPRDCLSFDIMLRKWLAPFVQRGQVALRITLQREENALLTHVVPKLKKLQSAWSQVATDLGYDPGQVIDLRFLLERVVIEHEKPEETAVEQGLKAAFETAVQVWQEMREVEGRALAHDIRTRIAKIETYLTDVKKNAPKAVEEYRERLTSRLKEISQDIAANEERVVREAALMAEKLDIAEEITRLHSHFDQMLKALEGAEKGVGRAMEFLVQEMHREMNTLGSKSTNLEISQLIIAMKAELEKIREQVQNIE